MESQSKMLEYREGLFKLVITKPRSFTHNLLRRLSQFKKILCFDLENYQTYYTSRYAELEEQDFYAEIATHGLYEEELAALKNILTIPQKILVIGSGSGRESLALAKLGHEVTGIDLSPKMIKLAEKYGEPKLKLKYLLKNVEDLEDLYDVVFISFGVTSHIRGREQRLKFLKSCKGRLNPKGKLLQLAYRRPLKVGGHLWWASQMLRLKGKYEKGDTLLSHLGHHTTSEELIFLHLYQSDFEVQKELEAAGLKVQMSKGRRLAWDSVWIGEKN